MPARKTPSFSSTSQAIAYYTRRKPDAPAVIDGGLRISYRQVAANVVQFTNALRALSVEPGTSVGIHTDDRYLHWLLILGCEIIGAPIISLWPTDLEDPNRALIRRCDLVFTSVDHKSLAEMRTFLLRPDWVKNIMKDSITSEYFTCLHTYVDPNSINRFCCSSGTTGEPKFFAITNKAKQARIDNNCFMNARHIRFPRNISIYNFQNMGAHMSLTSTIHMGGTIIFSMGGDFLEDIHRYQANMSLLVSGDFVKIVDSIPDSYKKPDLFKIDIRGGTVSSAARTRALDKIASHINIVYASNETGNITSSEADGASDILPGVSVKIADEAGGIKETGEPGVIWVKTNTMTTQYFDNADLTAASFRDGWFKLNDIGFIKEPHQLIVLGRSDEMLNIGGTKVWPTQLEDQLRSIPGVRDAAIVCVANEHGVGEPCVAIEADRDIDRTLILDLISLNLYRHTKSFHLDVLPYFPRTDTQKIKRNVLKQHFQAGLYGKTDDDSLDSSR